MRNTDYDKELKEVELRNEMKEAVKDLHNAIKRVSKACKKMEKSRHKLNDDGTKTTCGCEICPFSSNGLSCMLSSDNVPMLWDTRTKDIMKVGKL